LTKKGTDVWVDALGQAHAQATAPARIVCLVPSITELLCDLGLAAQIVGRTGFCIHPKAQVKQIAKVGGTKAVNIEKIRKLQPTHLVVNIDENEKPTVQALREFVPHVIVTHPNAPEDNLPLFRLLGGIFNRVAEAEALCTALGDALTQAHTPTLTRASKPTQSTHFPPHRVLYLIWKDPWMTVSADTYIARMLALVNLHVLPQPAGPRYPQIDLETVPEEGLLMLLSSEPYSFNASHVSELAQRFPRNHVALIDGEMVSWYGSRAIAGVRYLRDFAQALPNCIAHSSP
jgi:ABC-type Fe3+-hydroxamate transport system substrate-binding protein